MGRWISNDPLQKDVSAMVKLGELNGYRYVMNNPMKYVDPEGMSYVTCSGFLGCTADFLTDVYYGPKRYGWNGVASYFRTIGSNISADLLQHSLQNEPGHLNFGNNSNLSKKIRESSDYNDFVNEKIAEAEAKGKTVINKTWKDDKGITFKEGDLSTSIHGTKSTTMTGVLDDDGNWNIDVQINDVYDFKEKELPAVLPQ